MTTKTRRQFSPEFKREAVELANQPGHTISGVARDLGIREGRQVKYQCVADHRHELPVAMIHLPAHRLVFSRISFGSFYPVHELTSKMPTMSAANRQREGARELNTKPGSHTSILISKLMSYFAGNATIRQSGGPNHLRRERGIRLKRRSFFIVEVYEDMTRKRGITHGFDNFLSSIFLQSSKEHRASFQCLGTSQSDQGLASPCSAPIRLPVGGRSPAHQSTRSCPFRPLLAKLAGSRMRYCTNERFAPVRDAGRRLGDRPRCPPSATCPERSFE